MFFISSFWLIAPIFIKYNQAKTSFIETKEEITSNDLPAVSFCLRMDARKGHYEYGKDIMLTVEIIVEGIWADKATLELLDVWTQLKDYKFRAEKISTDDKLAFGLMASVAEDEDRTDYDDCYKVSSLWVAKSEDQLSRLSFRIKAEFTREVPKQGSVYFTSEANAYGVGWKKWFDGKVEEHVLAGSCRHQFVIKDVKKYQFLRQTCSPESYYECLGHRFAKANFAKYDNLHCNIQEPRIICLDNIDCQKEDCNGAGLQKCPIERLCSPLSFPKHVGVIHCNISTEKLDLACGHFVLSYHRDDQKYHCKKSCAVVEYSARDETVEDVHCKVEGRDWFTIEYRFGFPDSSVGLRSETPFKTVLEEYYILDDRGLVGNVGGTLGLFTGFSFFGVATWATGLWMKVKVKLSKPRTLSTNGKMG